MDIEQYRDFKKKLDKLKDENKQLRKKLADLKKEDQSISRALRDFQNLFTHMPGGVILIQQGKILLISQTGLNELGYTENEVLGRDFTEFIHPDFVEHINIVHKKRISGKSVPSRYETCLSTESGAPLYCDVRIKKIRYHGRNAFLVCLARIDQEKLNETQFSRSGKVEDLVRLASGLPRGFEQCLKILNQHALHLRGMITLSDTNLVKSLKEIEAAKETGDIITQQMDSFAHMDLKGSEAVRFDLRSVVQEAVALTQPRWKEDTKRCGIQIHVRTYLRTSCVVEGYPKQIQDVLVAMLLNGIDAMPEGGEIFWTIEENSGFANVYIQDTGVGIPDDIRDKIFDPFFTTKHRTRLGLGLSLAHAVITRHRGQIDVTSRPGEGTTFIIKLPIAPEAALTGAAASVKNIRDCHVLMIAGEGIVEEVLSQLLQGKGARVTVTTAPSEALKLLRKHKIDLIIADQDMPYLELSKTIPRIKKIIPGLPVAIVNTEDDDTSARVLKGLGVDLVISRPLKLDKVLSVICNTISARNNTD